MSNKKKKRSDKERKKAIKLLKETIDKDKVSKMMLSVADGLLFNGYVIIEQTFDSDLDILHSLKSGDSLRRLAEQDGRNLSNLVQKVLSDYATQKEGELRSPRSPSPP